MSRTIRFAVLAGAALTLLHTGAGRSWAQGPPNQPVIAYCVADADTWQMWPCNNCCSNWGDMIDYAGAVTDGSWGTLSQFLTSEDCGTDSASGTCTYATCGDYPYYQWGEDTFDCKQPPPPPPPCSNDGDTCVNGSQCCSGNCTGSNTCCDANVGNTCAVDGCNDACGSTNCDGSCDTSDCDFDCGKGSGCVSNTGSSGCTTDVCGDSCGTVNCDGSCDGSGCPTSCGGGGGGGGDDPCAGCDDECLDFFGEYECIDDADPILIDLTGDGFLMTDANSGVNFDFFGSGKPLRLSWTAASAQNGGWLLISTITARSITARNCSGTLPRNPDRQSSVSASRRWRATTHPSTAGTATA